MNIIEKKLKDIIANSHRICLAFSGGVDSTLLLYLLSREKPVVAVLVDGAMVKREDILEAETFARSLSNVTLVTVPFDVFKVPEFLQNQRDRCYYCKKALFEEIREVAAQNNCDILVDGTNVDDLSDYRPGLKALEEIGVTSPFVQAGATKDDIYYLSNYYDLPTKTKPAAACLASRIKTGLTITSELLEKVEKGEQLLQSYGFGQLRLRLIDPENGYIEILNSDFNLFYEKVDEFYPLLKEIGINIEKKPHLYQQGSMNERIEMSKEKFTDNETVDENAETGDVIILTDEDGNDVEFEFLGVVDYDDSEYVILTNQTQPDEDEGIYTEILKVEGSEDGEEYYVTIDDDDILDAVYNLFKEENSDYYDFID